MRVPALLLAITAVVYGLNERQTDNIAVEPLSAKCLKRQTNTDPSKYCSSWDGVPLNGPPGPFPCSCLDNDDGGGSFPGTGKVEAANTEENNFIDYTIGKNAPANFNSLSGFAFTDNTNEIFVVAKAGYIFHVDMITEEITTFMDLSNQVHNNGDYGMLSVETHTDFKNNPYLYASYVNTSIIGSNAEFNTISYVRVMRIVVNNAKPASFTYILGKDLTDTNPLCSSSHAGGALAMGHDGSLFITLGEGSFFDAGPFDFGQVWDKYPLSKYCSQFFPGQGMGSMRAQSKESLGGKLIRVDPATGDGICDSNNGKWTVYNPYCTAGIDLRSPRARIYAMGFRNPFSMNVRPHQDGDIACGVPYVGDVGLGSYEEVNAATTPGLNFGWPCWEGPQPMGGFRDSPFNDLQAFTNFTRPMTDDGKPFSCPYVYSNVVTQSPTYYWSRYTHKMAGLYGEQYVLGAGFTGNCVSGVNFYTGTSYPVQFQNQVFFSDYGSQWIKSFTSTSDKFNVQYAFQSLSVAVVDLEVHPVTKDMCYLELLAGDIHCLSYASGVQPPVVSMGADVLAGPLPLTVQFRSDGTYDRDASKIEYIAWNFGDGSDIVIDPNPSHTYTTAGVFTAVIYVNNGAFTVNKTMMITAGHVPPVVHIVLPEDGSTDSFKYSLYNSSRDEPITFAGTATQATGSVSYFWDIYMVHTNHYHPESYVSPMQTFSATKDQLGASSHVGERINFLVILTGTDSLGISSSSYIRLSEAGWTSNAPIPSFTYTAYSPLSAGQPVRFDASKTYDIDLDTISYLWDFGDGHVVNFNTESNNKFYSHAYSKPGTYTVTLTTVDNWGEKSTTTQTLTVDSGYVQNPPAVNIPTAPPVAPQSTRTVAPTTKSQASPGTPDATIAQSAAGSVQISIAVMLLSALLILQ